MRFAEPDRDTLELPASAVEAVLSRAHALGGRHRRLQRGRDVPDLRGHRRRRPRASARACSSTPSTPHRTAAIDVAALGGDALACSAYKWFGPHIGILWARPELLADLKPDKLRPSPDTVPDRWELGTLPFESLVGVRAAADFMLELDREAVRAHEGRAAGADGRGPGAIDGVTLHGAAPDRTPTVMFTVAGRTSPEVAEELARAEIAVWDGSDYALELARWLDLEPDGAIRAGVVAYNDPEDVDRLLEAVAESRASQAAVMSDVLPPARPVSGARATQASRLGDGRRRRVPRRC